MAAMRLLHEAGIAHADIAARLPCGAGSTAEAGAVAHCAAMEALHASQLVFFLEVVKQEGGHRVESLG